MLAIDLMCSSFLRVGVAPVLLLLLAVASDVSRRLPAARMPPPLRLAGLSPPCRDWGLTDFSAR
jgi:hypothetical protein